ncbi:hypothetical protein, conserved [Trypanosoma brucei brucei TREU927]|uniref:tRNA ligase phosphodiesterase domain-containing protein n=1 Tax=Trypanosoma brucei brucei (strain 927/4 GUTat10.1) TaxID=185431 RepID=Q57XG4_TRYB2|nr:hypothetical protein, conserved [Trypanosoma brucei brucei TREU927]AAX69710.1 hypothetical protein, conserved [Trypanosoma brucei]AAZ12992.1 hypothetical protein, conserved [Trypanosoma brucei brucei TREU927]
MDAQVGVVQQPVTTSSTIWVGECQCPKWKKSTHRAVEQNLTTSLECGGERDALLDVACGSGIDIDSFLREKWIRVAFTSSFGSNSRVRVRARRVRIGSHEFVVVERNVFGCDDSVYRKDNKLWEGLPRGQACVFVESGDRAGFIPIGRLQGLRKFNSFDGPYGIRGRQPVSAVAMEAIDGDCGHISAFVHTGERYWLVGNKDTHLLVSFSVPEKDIFSNTAEGGAITNEGDKPLQGANYSPPSLAVRIARLWGQTLRALPDEKSFGLHEFLSSNRYTACFDAVLQDCGHLVDYGEDELLQFYALTQSGESLAEGLCVDPVSAIVNLQSFGLRVVPFHSEQCSSVPEILDLGTDEYSQYGGQVARRLNCRGAVMYGLDAQGIVVRLWKLPSHAYVVERAAQEAIVTHRLSGTVLRDKLRRKLDRLPKEIRRCVTEWSSARLEPLLNLAAWLHIMGKVTPEVGLDGLQEVRRSWITLQQQLVKHTKDMREHLQLYEPPVAEAAINNPDVIMCVGPQGCGKSTFCRAFCVLLQKVGQKPRWINQDEVGGRNEFIEAIRRAKESDCTHILIDKMNLDDAARNADYASFNLKTITVAWVHPCDVDVMVSTCLERVCHRGNAHRTFRGTVSPGKKRKMMTIIRGCVQRCEPPTTGIVIEANVLDPPAITIESVWKGLCRHTMSELPDIKDLSVADALEIARRYELLLSHSSRPFNCGIIKVVNSELLVALVPADYLEGKKMRKELDISTIYLGDRSHFDLTLLSELQTLEGTSIQVAPVRIASDAKATAIEIRNNNEFPCQNAHPHITIATAPGVPAKYSNELLSKVSTETSDIKVMEVSPDVSISGVFQFVR